MTATLPYSRTLSKQFVARSTWSFTRRTATNPLLRVTCNCNPSAERSIGRHDYLHLVSAIRPARAYATSAEKPASKPKAHTGRAPAKRTSTTTKAKPAKKTTKKPKKKAVKKAKPKGRKPLSTRALLQKQRQNQRQNQAELRATALLEEPKQLPQTAFTLVFVEDVKNGGDARSASARYRSLSPEEREVFIICPGFMFNSNSCTAI